jgi:hypothetical protein
MERQPTQGSHDRKNAVFRKNGLKPVEWLHGSDAPSDHVYFVKLVVLGTCVEIKATFQRVVTFYDGIRERSTLAETWDKCFVAPGASPKNVDAILQGVSELTEIFANEFLLTFVRPQRINGLCRLWSI